MASSGTVYLFTPAEHGHLTPYLAALHAACVTVDRTIATFLPPLTQDKLLGYWRERIAEATSGTRAIYLLLDESEPGTRAKGGELMGVAMLEMPATETGARRGVIEKLLVASKYRRRGGARALMAALEADAARRGRTLLLVDTETGSVGEAVYKTLGYVEVGKIPNYCFAPPNGELKDETFFYKQL